MRYAIIEDGSAREIHVGQSFMATALVETADGSEVQAFMACREWFSAFTPDDWALYSIKTVIPASPAPEGQRVASTALEVDGADVVEAATYEAAPAPADPPRRLIAKAVVQQRLLDAGLLDEVFAALQASPENFAKWFVPGWPNVYADDQVMIDVLDAVGADIEAITAP